MDDLIAEFLVETNDNLQALDNDFVKLEQDSGNKDIINNIFRSMHTIKGTCGFLGLERLAKLAHAAENVMDKLREGAFSASPGVISLILKANDQIKSIIEYLESNESEPEGTDQELIDALNACADSGGTNVGAGAASPAPAAEAAPAAASLNKTPDLDEPIDFEPVKADYAGGPAAETTQASGPANKTPDLDEPIDFEPVKADYAGGPSSPTVASPPPPAKAEISSKAKEDAVAKGLKAAAEEDPDKKGGGGQSIRVGLDVLENLMQMVGELVLTRNQLLQLLRTAGDDAMEFMGPLQRLNLITTELQEGVMQTRMQPIGNAWAKFPRLIRDLSIELNKKIELKMIGADTELDRQMLEAIKDPLTHMVRNSADHGVDTPAERIAAGKNDTGIVTLSAYHEGGHIIIKIADDGRGLNIDRIKKKALENGLATETELANMTDKQIYQFIFKAGFSTAEKITAVSGRGVGMDVVVSNIQKIGGTIELNSKPGRGSEFIIKLPLTLAIMSVLIVKSGTETFAIPQIRVSEIVRTEQPNMDEHDRNGSYKVEMINGAPVLRIRGRLLPLLSVSETLQIVREPAADNDNTSSQPGVRGAVEPFVVVAEVGSQQVGLLVDEVFHTEEIVVKPLAKILKNLEVYSGCTILGDGSVIMILDPGGIIKVCGETLAEDKGNDDREDDSASGVDRIVNFLTFKAWSKSPKAVPLDLVSRLEEVDAKNIEWSGHQPVVQYRGSLMRLVTLDAATPIPQEGMIEVIVFNDGDKTMGLVVEGILDIVKQAMDVVSPTSEVGLLGSVVIGDTAMDLMDISYCFSRTFGGWLGHEEAKALDRPASGAAAGRPHILLVDDSPFFRKFMKPVLTVAGFDVTDASSAQEGLEYLHNTKYSFDLVVTDIDMPEMNGLEFVAAARKDARLAALPYIALSSHQESDLGDIRGQGLSAFVTKSDRDKLVEVIHSVLAGGGKVAA